jgi:hypothetical protein
MTVSQGHRERLRRRFQSDPDQLSPAQTLELLLTYAIPRQDMAPLAEKLLAHFGSLEKLFQAGHDELIQVNGVGETTAALIQLVATLHNQPSGPKTEAPLIPIQSSLLADDALDAFDPPSEPGDQSKKNMRTFTNDLAGAALEYLPQIVTFQQMAEFQRHLEETLPYNSISSRKRYARNLLNRYYPANNVDTPLTQLFTWQPAKTTLQAALFYETVRAEPTVKFVAEEIIWPALPTGDVSRQQLRQQIESRFPDVSLATIKRMVYSLLNVYAVFGIGELDEERLRIQVHESELPAFLYILTAEFPQPGIYSFDALEQGPLRRWLLWDREWLRRQLYNLRDFGVVSKISEIDAMRQFTLALDQREALRCYFDHPRRGEMALRETAVTETLPS